MMHSLKCVDRNLLVAINQVLWRNISKRCVAVGFMKKSTTTREFASLVEVHFQAAINKRSIYHMHKVLQQTSFNIYYIFFNKLQLFRDEAAYARE